MNAGAPVVIWRVGPTESGLEILRDEHPDLTVHTCDSYVDLPAILEQTGAEVVYSVRFAGTSGFPRDTLVGTGAVRWVSVGGSGTDHLMPPWDTGRVTVTNAAGVAADMMAEYALGAMLAFSLDLRGFEQAQKARRWLPGRVRPIEGRTLLIVGLGHTGRALAWRARALGLRVLGIRASPAPTEHVDETFGVEALAEVLPEADFVTICVPLLPTTRGLIGAEAFAAMRPGAVLIDVSRGGVVDGAALVAALVAGRIAGAALDVFEEEPLPAGHPLWEMGNVILTPHCSSVYDGWERRSAAMFSKNLSRYRRGEPLCNIVDPYAATSPED